MARARPTARKEKAPVPKKAPKRPPAKATPPAKSAKPSPPLPSLAERTALLTREWAQLIGNKGFLALETVDGLTLSAAAGPGPKPTWVLVTSGLWPQGAEVSLRIARAADERVAPAWGLGALRAIATSLRSSQRPLSDNESFTPALPLLRELETELSSVAFMKDQSFQVVETRWDTIGVLLAVGITADEAKLLREWSPHGFLEVYGKADPAYVTDPDRASLLSSPRARTIIEQRVEREGSSLQSVSAALSSVETVKAQTVWTLCLEALDPVVSLLKGRTAHQRPFAVVGPAQTLQVIPSDQPGYSSPQGHPTLRLSQPAARALRAQLRPKRGRVSIDALPGFTIEVV